MKEAMWMHQALQSRVSNVHVKSIWEGLRLSLSYVVMCLTCYGGCYPCNVAMWSLMGVSHAIMWGFLNVSMGNVKIQGLASKKCV